MPRFFELFRIGRKKAQKTQGRFTRPPPRSQFLSVQSVLNPELCLLTSVPCLLPVRRRFLRSARRDVASLGEGGSRALLFETCSLRVLTVRNH